MAWCPRCGTSLSQHELIDSYRDLTHPSLYVYLPLADADGEALVVWTTTPWTLPANVAAAVQARGATTSPSRRDPAWRGSSPSAREAVFGARSPGRCAASQGCGARRARPYHGPFAEPAGAGATSQPRVIAWDDVGVDEGTGIVHIAPGCGAEDFELGKREGLPVLVPVDEAGCFHDGVRRAARAPHARDVATADRRGPRAARPPRCAPAS